MVERNTFHLMLLILGVVFAFLYIPMIILVIYSFNSSRLVTVWAGRISTSKRSAWARIWSAS